MRIWGKLVNIIKRNKTKTKKMTYYTVIETLRFKQNFPVFFQNSKKNSKNLKVKNCYNHELIKYLLHFRNQVRTSPSRYRGDSMFTEHLCKVWKVIQVFCGLGQFKKSSTSRYFRVAVISNTMLAYVLIVFIFNY